MNLTRHLSQLLKAAITKSTITRHYADEMKLIFCAGNKTYYNNKVVKQVDIPCMDGDCGILAKHVPTLAVIKPGVVAVHELDDSVQKVFVSSGIATVNDDSTVQIISECGYPLDEFDAGAAREQLAKAQSDLISASNDYLREEAYIAISVCEAILKVI